MSKRPPEMVELVTFAQDMDGSLEPDIMGRWVRAEDAVSAIRSLRVKLFRERADIWAERAVVKRDLGNTKFNNSTRAGFYEIADRYSKKASRFTRIADAIERGER